MYFFKNDILVVVFVPLERLQSSGLCRSEWWRYPEKGKHLFVDLTVTVTWPQVNLFSRITPVCHFSFAYCYSTTFALLASPKSLLRHDCLIGHFQEYIILFVCLPTLLINTVSIFCRDSQWSQDKINAMLMQIFGGQTKNIKVYKAKAWIWWFFKPFPKANS